MSDTGDPGKATIEEAKAVTEPAAKRRRKSNKKGEPGSFAGLYVVGGFGKGSTNPVSAKFRYADPRKAKPGKPAKWEVLPDLPLWDDRDVYGQVISGTDSASLVAVEGSAGEPQLAVCGGRKCQDDGVMDVFSLADRKWMSGGVETELLLESDASDVVYVSNHLWSVAKLGKKLVKLDPRTTEVKDTIDLPRPRNFHPRLLAVGSSLYFFDGYAAPLSINPRDDATIQTIVDVYDTLTGLVVHNTPPPTPLQGTCMATYNNCIFRVGGVQDKKGKMFRAGDNVSEACCFHVASYTWKPIAPAPVRIGDGVLLPFGNALYLTTGLVQAPGKRKRTHNRQTYKYDIAKDQWIEPDVA
eukprot:CAMPEP_0119126586 /NCGR_PEP_ID=MMETSP1310-20130426/5459_1 /TAXON_ID=464262 /ORGANISM="Genus nov. species nov., Strain RCC2339" /LENGTH=354 /DNA_ID=CAMNT_0007116755 /DNA_START=340 /DNA_END=1399 /DNA_ORIENTATION=+